MRDHVVCQTVRAVEGSVTANLERGAYSPSLELAFKLREQFTLPIEAVFSPHPFPPLCERLSPREREPLAQVRRWSSANAVLDEREQAQLSRSRAWTVKGAHAGCVLVGLLLLFKGQPISPTGVGILFLTLGTFLRHVPALHALAVTSGQPAGADD